MALALSDPTVHRPVHMDTIGIKQIAKDGTVTGEWRFVGLFTSVAYNLSPRAIPLLRQKVDRVLKSAGFRPQSHDGKALAHILDSYPRIAYFNAQNLWADLRVHLTPIPHNAP